MLSRRDLALLLIGTANDGSLQERPIGGVTRLQKYLFLLENEYGLTSSDGGFQFTAYKNGPYSSKLYDDLELLENLGTLKSERTISPLEIDEADSTPPDLSFDDLVAGPSERAPAVPEERSFALTQSGIEFLRNRVGDANLTEAIDRIAKVKSRFGGFSLLDLLRYVYTKYPQMAEASEIRDKVLGKGK